ncbi:MAG: glycoside hydrolase family 3 C-terminal domain-containing protein [Prevotellaceae bacterium]|nr:glycoside hydrolase family 3 C-terminal domain-containing protein [Prevotellaceae bacterium]
MKKLLSTTLIAVAFTAASAQTYLDPNAPLEARVQDALSRMTVHEKVQLLHAQSKFTSAGVPRLGIPELKMSDGPHGCRAEIEWNSWNYANWTNDSIVAFPSLTCLASTWNRDLSRLYGDKVSEEFAYREKDVMLGPGTTIARCPFNGRSFEYMGEDPFLAGEMAVPYIQGAQKNGVACCLKHFFLNNHEVNRMTVNVNVSERAVEEIYLPAFEKCVKESGLWTMMGSYNKWLNVHCCQNDSLLNGILKKRWGFDGAVISDWGGCHDTWEAATGGLDIEMGSFTNGMTADNSLGYNTYFLADPFESLVKQGKISEEVLNDKAARVLRTIFRTAMNPNKVRGKLCTDDHYDVCRRVGEEGIVLLKNERIKELKYESLLPLDASRYNRILVVGDNATRNMSQGGGSSELKTKYDISPLEGLKAVYGDKIDFAQGYYAGRPMYANVEELDPAKQAELKAEALAKAKQADLIIFIGGMNKNHQQDCEGGDRLTYDLSYGQNELIAELAAVQPNIVCVMYAGNPYATPWIDKVKALVQCWYLGSESGRSLANVLSGKVNPSGKLPITFAKNMMDYPCFQYGEEGYPGVDDQVYYKEGIYVGYRHFDTRKVKPQFPFGFGLSYTTFKYGKPTLSGNTVSVSVTNTGTREGKETVQLYVGDVKCSVDRPVKELKGFEKVSLAPGETKTVSFTIAPRDLQFFDEATHQWKSEPGKFKLYIGASSADIRGVVDYELK